ncbi:host attachment family protein [Parvularcula sp. LCG005]|uniref:host attachment family protein n=1 Tax=Parvularcula sp. LCG005 TaxID=3078805 RepID=UPI00294289EF|nr:host attachment family protein [Parvularcula sp. LCG005]WOI54788.1 host attachment family protein [Parvularcula sp. LCG005]
MNLVDTMWVAVADGEKALILRNDDTDSQPFLNVVSKEEIDNPARRDQAANRRGRVNNSNPDSAHRSAYSDTDWHELGKERFAKDFAATLNKAALNNAFDRLILIASPSALGNLRPELHDEVQKRIVAEVDSDLTNHPVDDIENKVAELCGKGEPDFEADLRRSS